ncbi:recombinase family protein [Acholeplasma sp. OttesenSCG-928-E16]|nr:recombinase family protein [Acholeplasma sp. OttesenSCG-928-E16]
MSEKVITVIPAKKKETISKYSTKLLRVAGYARVSSEKDEQLNSLSMQKKNYTEYIKRRNEWKFVGIYYDEGLSGLSIKKRDGFNRMVNDALEGKIDLIVTKSISRFARNTIDTLTVTRKLKEKNVAVFFEKENLNTFDPLADTVLAFLASFAEGESRNMSEIVRWGKRKQFKDGKFGLAYSLFLGYKKGPNKNEMIIDHETAPVVRLIYQLFLEDNCCFAISKRLNQLGIPSPGNKRWRKNTVHSILSNEKYKGDALLQKKYTVNIFTKKTAINDGKLPQYYIENSHEGIVSKKVFDEVQKRLCFQSTDTSSIHTFSGKLVCSLCGKKYGSKHSQQHRTWVCNNRYGNSMTCTNIRFLDDEVNYACNQLYLFMYQKYHQVFNYLKSQMKSLYGLNLTNDNPEVPQNDFTRRVVFRVIVKNAIMMPDRTIKFNLIDGTSFSYTVPRWSTEKRRPWTKRKRKKKPKLPKPPVQD